MDVVGFLSMVIQVMLFYVQKCLKYNTYSAWFLDIRILTCLAASIFTIATYNNLQGSLYCTYS